MMTSTNVAGVTRPGPARSGGRPRVVAVRAAATDPAHRVPAGLPRRWVDIVLPAELPALGREIIRRVRDEIPEYRVAREGLRSKSVRETTQVALVGYTGQYCRTGALSPDTEQYFRELGRREALEGRGTELAQAAFRVGALAAWRRLLAMCEREPLPADTVGSLAESIFGFADLLARLTADGHGAAHGNDTVAGARLRARLARMICNQPDASADAIRELAARLDWAVPEQVVVLDIRYDLAEQDPYPALLAAFGPEALAEIEPGSRLVVLPAPADAAAIAAVAAAVPGSRISVGCTLPLPQAGQSLRWARLAARLRGEGLLPDEPVLVSDEHVPTLLLQAEPGLAFVLVRRRLAPLIALPAPRRLKFGRLLAAWLEHGGSQAELAQQLGTHRQTLHYRIGRLQEMFGAQLRDAQARVEIMLALRAALPQWEAAASIE